MCPNSRKVFSSSLVIIQLISYKGIQLRSKAAMSLILLIFFEISTKNLDPLLDQVVLEDKLP